MFKRLSLLVSCLAILFFAFAARADEWNKKTILTFNQPVELPGVVLPAGTYVFKLVDLPGARDIVQVFNQNENQLFATIIAIPHLHPVAHEKPYIGFEERPSNAPVAIHEWFYPGEVSGLEFVYPKTRAVELARETHQPVLAAEVKPSETPVELQTEIVVEVTPENKEVQIAENYEPAPPPPLVVEERREEVIVETLPSTASPLFLIGRGGVLSLIIAAGIKRVSVIK